MWWYSPCIALKAHVRLLSSWNALWLAIWRNEILVGGYQYAHSPVKIVILSPCETPSNHQHVRCAFAEGLRFTHGNCHYCE